MLVINVIVVLASALALAVMVMWGFGLSAPEYRGNVKEHIIYVML